MKKLFTFLLFIVAAQTFGQVKYEKGYLVDNDGKRMECLIKNREWQSNPTEFTYKPGNSGTAQTGDVNSVREFGIYNYYKFVAADVKIDRSVNPKTSITTDKEPLWKQEKLFLKVLEEGKANLYVYEGPGFQRFFYSVDKNPISQLVYKEYKVDMSLVKNTTFRQQIWKDLPNLEVGMDKVKFMNYTANELENYFQSYNKKVGDATTEIIPKERTSYLTLKLTPGVNFNSGSMSLPVTGSSQAKEMTYEGNQGLRFGLEAEWLFAYKKYKWAVLFEPTFQSYKSESTPEEGTIDYSSVEFPIGIRYYYQLGYQTRLYLNGFYVPRFAMNFDSNVNYIPDTNVPKSFDVKASGNMAFGGGVDYKKFSMEARYYTDRNLSDQPYLDPTYSRFSIILGYKIFSTKN